MATASVTYALTNGTTADASQVDTNFDDLVGFLNGSVVHKDGSVSMTGLLTLHAADPSTANHATRKSYVDGLVPSASTSFTPTWVQGGAIPKTVNYAQYVRIGPLVIGSVMMTATAGGTTGEFQLVGLPAAATGNLDNAAIGSYRFFDASVTNRVGTLVLSGNGASSCHLVADGTGADLTDQVDTTDFVTYTFLYLVA
jgi:hypothetical protein